MLTTSRTARLLGAATLLAAVQLGQAAQYQGNTVDFTIASTDWGQPTVTGDTLSFTLNFTEYAKFGLADFWNELRVDAHPGFSLTGDVQSSITGSYDFTGAIPPTLAGQAGLGSTVLVSSTSAYLGSTGAYATTAASTGAGDFELFGAAPSGVTPGQYDFLALSIMLTAVSSPTGSTATIAKVTFTPVSLASPVPEHSGIVLMLAGLVVAGVAAVRHAKTSVPALPQNLQIHA